MTDVYTELETGSDRLRAAAKTEPPTKPTPRTIWPPPHKTPSTTCTPPEPSTTTNTNPPKTTA
ncbi:MULTISPECIES: hypothetical protein [Nocardia]|uniref:hypothetical protein n=1 Tax=Nocardia TaxID=1817 RepID=UPI002453C186|nr:MULTISPECIES: hypothetical protein [Nocardia]